MSPIRRIPNLSRFFQVMIRKDLLESPNRLRYSKVYLNLGGRMTRIVALLLLCGILIFGCTLDEGDIFSIIDLIIKVIHSCIPGASPTNDVTFLCSYLCLSKARKRMPMYSFGRAKTLSLRALRHYSRLNPHLYVNLSTYLLNDKWFLYETCEKYLNDSDVVLIFRIRIQEKLNSFFDKNIVDAVMKIT